MIEPFERIEPTDPAAADPVEADDSIEPDDADDPIISTINLGKTFGTVEAVSDLNLEVSRGSITGVVGPNGAGKSTTFLMLATLLEPTTGGAIVCGFDPVDEPREVRSRMGYMPDFFGIYDDLSVSEYLDFFGAAYCLPPAKRRSVAGDLLALVDLTDKKDAFVDSLSRGMKQRLCLARALVHDPELLILDEPASGLDPRGRIELRALLHELQRMGKTIVISSHILSELQEICSHVAILEDGKLIAQGEPSSILAGFAQAGRYLVRTNGDPDALRAALAVAGQHLIETRGGDGVLVEIPGGPEAAAHVLHALVVAGIPIVGFSEEETGLEELFLRVTKGAMS